MSGTPDPEDGHAQGSPADPSMEDILASIRRILNEDPSVDEVLDPQPRQLPEKDVLVLDEGMMTTPEPTPEGIPAAFHVPEPVEAMSFVASQPELAEPELPPFAAEAAMTTSESDARLLAPETAEAAGNAMSQLAVALAAQRHTLVHRGGPTIEDLIREELRPLLKAWLDANLPPLVERLVRAEIDRLGVGRAL